MYSLQEKLAEYKTKHQNKLKEKIQLQNIEKIKPKIVAKENPTKLLQQPQKEQEEFIRKFSIYGYLSDIEFTPKNLSWIEYLLKWKPKAKQYEILKKYKRLYMEAYNETTIEHQKINAGQLKANTWLRELLTGD